MIQLTTPALLNLKRLHLEEDKQIVVLGSNSTTTCFGGASVV